MPDDDKPDQTEQKSDAEARINALVGQRNDAQTEVQRLAQQMSELDRQNKNLTTLLEKINTKPSSETDDLASALDPGKKSSGRAQEADVASLVEQAVQKALKPVHDRFETWDNQTKRREAQTRAFNQAVEIFPDLLQGESELSKTAEKILAGHPKLSELEDAPLLAAYLARGALSDARQADSQAEDAKRKAAANRPASGDRLGRTTPPAGDTREIREQVTQRLQGRPTTEDFSNAFRLALTEATNEQKE